MLFSDTRGSNLDVRRSEKRSDSDFSPGCSHAPRFQKSRECVLSVFVKIKTVIRMRHHETKSIIIKRQSASIYCNKIFYRMCKFVIDIQGARYFLFQLIESQAVLCHIFFNTKVTSYLQYTPWGYILFYHETT